MKCKLCKANFDEMRSVIDHFERVHPKEFGKLLDEYFGGD